MTAIGRRLFAIFIVALTFMCFVQMLTDFFDASPSFQLKNSVHANEQYILIPPAKTGDGAKKGPATQDGAAIFRKMIGSRKTNMLPPARSPRRPLKPGRKLQQEVYELSNGTAVGWLLRYDREKFPLLHASPACGKHDIYVAFVVSAGRNFDRRQVCRWQYCIIRSSHIRYPIRTRMNVVFQIILLGYPEDVGVAIEDGVRPRQQLDEESGIREGGLP